MLEIIAALFFGLFCMILGFYGGYLLSENKNLKSILADYELEDTRYELERQFDEPD